VDWIERWFNISPDNGDGTLELLVFTVLFVVASALVASTRPAVHKAVRSAYAVISRFRDRKSA
jgi:hypothetical protein